MDAPHLHFDSDYAPFTALIVPDGADYKDEAQAIWIQGDEDMLSVAYALGWDETSGTSWHDFLHNQAGIPLAGLTDYLQQCEITTDPNDPDDDWHITRVCEFCGYIWRGMHCQCDGHQNPCPNCDKRPIRRPCPKEV